jgi:hypothetical protein
VSATSDPLRPRSPLGALLFRLRHPGGVFALSKENAAAKAGIAVTTWNALEYKGATPSRTTEARLCAAWPDLADEIRAAILNNP